MGVVLGRVTVSAAGRPKPGHLYAFLCALALTGCQTLAPTGERAVTFLQPLILALEAPTDRLRDDAGAGDAFAQYALSIQLAEGLRGVAKNPDEAAVWRGSAFNVQTRQRVGLYAPSVNGGAGSTRVADLPRPVIIYYQTLVVDGCVDFLAGRTQDPRWCGGVVPAERFRAAWSAR